jgi:hypothetical protein
MRVHFIDYPIFGDNDFIEYYDDFEEISRVLKLPNGPLSFQPVYNYSVEETDLEGHFKFEAIVSEANEFRNWNYVTTVQEDEFVIVLSPMAAIDKDFFSYYDQTLKSKNIVCHTKNKETNGGEFNKYLIAFEIVANILRILMKVTDKQRHKENRGCINDTCSTVEERILQIKNADLCEECISRIRSKGVDLGIVNQIIDIISSLRASVLNTTLFFNTVLPTVTISPTGEILVGNRLMDMDPLSRVLFIFFLKNIDGIKKEGLGVHKDNLVNIYTQLRKGKGRDEVEETIEKTIKKNFPTCVSRLNADIEKNLGNIIGEKFKLEGKGKKGYKINLPAELITDHFQVN